KKPRSDAVAAHGAVGFVADWTGNAAALGRDACERRGAAFVVWFTRSSGTSRRLGTARDVERTTNSDDSHRNEDPLRSKPARFSEDDRGDGRACGRTAGEIPCWRAHCGSRRAGGDQGYPRTARAHGRGGAVRVDGISIVRH